MSKKFQPVTNVSLQSKTEIMRSLYHPLMSALAGAVGGNDLTGDDLLEFFALGMAMVIDNDTHIVTPSAKREAAETCKSHIMRWQQLLGDIQKRGSISFLEQCNLYDPEMDASAVSRPN